MSEKPCLTPPKEIFFSETVVNKSRFLAFATNVEDYTQAVEFLNSIKKKHYDATHNCYAYVVGNSAKFSDDGEPSGTAGKPILNALMQKGFCDTIVVVTRYFGGIKLGAGGLVRAYGGVANDLLSKIPALKSVKCVDVSVSITYNALNAIVSLATKSAIKYTTDFDCGVKVVATVLTENVKQFIKDVENASNGKAEIKTGNEYVAKI